MRDYDFEWVVAGGTDDEIASAVEAVGLPTNVGFRVGVIDVDKIAETIRDEKMGPAWEMGQGYMWWIGESRINRPLHSQPVSVLGIAWFTLTGYCKVWRMVGERFPPCGRARRSHQRWPFGVCPGGAVYVHPVVWVLPELAIEELHTGRGTCLRQVYKTLREDPLDVASWAALADLLDDLDCAKWAAEARGKMAVVEEWVKRRMELEALRRLATAMVAHAEGRR